MTSDSVMYGCPFEEVSFGYPHRHWVAKKVHRHLRRIAPLVRRAFAADARSGGDRPG